MSVPSLPFIFTASTTAQSAQVNSNFSTLVSALSANLDSSNFSLARGLGANYIVSSGTGNTGVFQPGAFTFSNTTLSQVPLTVAAPSGQSADIFDVTLNGVNVLSVAANGLVQSPRIQIVGTNTALTPLTINAPNGQAGDLLDINVNSVLKFSIANDGTLNVGAGAINFTNASFVTFTSGAAGAVPAYIFNNGAFTGDLARYQIAGTTKFTIQNSGIPTWTGALAVAQGGTGVTSLAGTIVTTGDTGTVTNTMLAGSIAQSKLAAFAGVAVGGALTTVTTLAMTGALSGATTGAFSNLLTAAGPNTAGTAALLLENGDSNASPTNRTQIRFGYNGGDQYQNYIVSYHDAITLSGNALKFYTSDRTAAGVFPTNAILGLTVANGAITVPGAAAATNHVSTAAAVSAGAGTVSYGGTTATTVGAAGGAAALPATPLGYILINVAGTAARIPYYN